MQITVEDDRGDRLSFECADTLTSRMTCVGILEGRTYPHLPFLGEVTVAMDVGANCGAMSVHLARHHPDARIHAFEPGREAGDYLVRNVAAHPNVTVHHVGLSDTDREATLFLGHDDIGQSSLVRADASAAVVEETITLRDARAWVTEAGLDHVDILKVDVEGHEVTVLEALRPILPTVKALYVEYDSRQARRAIEALLAETHELYLAMLMALDQGECLYVRRDLADHPEAQPRLREIFLRPRKGT